MNILLKMLYTQFHTIISYLAVQTVVHYCYNFIYIFEIKIPLCIVYLCASVGCQRSNVNLQSTGWKTVTFNDIMNQLVIVNGFIMVFLTITMLLGLV